MNTVRLPGWSDPVTRAAKWLRDHLSIPDYESLDREFSEYFRCRLVKNDQWNGYDDCAIFVEFDSEPEATVFLLRWSA